MHVSGKARPVQLEPNLRLAIVGFWEMLSYQVTVEGRRIVYVYLACGTSDDGIAYATVNLEVFIEMKGFAFECAD